METCEDCGFAWERVADAEIGPRISRAAAAMAHELSTAAQEAVGRRPSPDRWSALEYAAHARDVMVLLRDRLVVGLVEDHPSFTPGYRDERLTLGLYRADTAAAVAPEVAAAATMFVRLFDAIDPASLGCTVAFGYPDPTTRTLRWMGQQVVHETEHHLGDVVEVLGLVGGI